jgi:hypothetical protein
MLRLSKKKHRTLRFSCGARSAFKLKEQDYLRNMLSRRQLQAFVRLLGNHSRFDNGSVSCKALLALRGRGT